ncbi:MAG: hypothetical protein QE271_08085 [Bacteriovoracaceae bacterium]|nr:hypothetical protein [Bacteriovoracaceae bacterium]
MNQKIININELNLARDYFANGFIDEAIDITENQLKDHALNLKSETDNQGGNLKFLNNFKNSLGDEILGIFDCNYHPYLSLEYAKVEKVTPSVHIQDSFTEIKCVRQLLATDGLLNEQVVAIFPENFKSVVPANEHPVFYFVDKFAKRHLKYTRPFIKKLMSCKVFDGLLDLREAKLCKLITNWVNFHERSHRTGPMPLPQFIKEKSNKYTAALEELRADLITIEFCFKNSKHKEDDYFLTGLYVLAERLCAYPLFRSQSNFDCISSIFFWKFLKNKNQNFTIEINLFQKSITEIISLIHDFETEASKHEEESVRKITLVNLVKKFIGNYENEFVDYKMFWSSL